MSTRAKLLAAADALDQMAIAVRPDLICSPFSRRVFSGSTEPKTSRIFYIPVPAPLKHVFPDPETHNNGHQPHITLFYVSSDDLEPGQDSTLLAIARKLGQTLPSMRIVMDANAGLKDFGLKEGEDDFALWLGVRDDPKGALARMHETIKKALVVEGLPHETFPVFTPHVTWAYVPNGISDVDRNRQSALASERVSSRNWFDVKNLVLDIGPHTYTIPLRGRL